MAAPRAIAKRARALGNQGPRRQVAQDRLPAYLHGRWRPITGLACNGGGDHLSPARRADLDNMLAAMKAGLDGVAQATGVDDSRWEYRIARGDPTKGGRVDVELSQP